MSLVEIRMAVLVGWKNIGGTKMLLFFLIEIMTEKIFLTQKSKAATRLITDFYS